MTDKTTNGKDDTEIVDAASLGKANNPISKATLVMIVGTIILVIIAAIVISRFFSAPTGVTSSASSTATRSNS